MQHRGIYYQGAGKDLKDEIESSRNFLKRLVDIHILCEQFGSGFVFRRAGSGSAQKNNRIPIQFCSDVDPDCLYADPDIGPSKH